MSAAWRVIDWAEDGRRPGKGDTGNARRVAKLASENDLFGGVVNHARD
jgi:hypothetical protein